MSNLNPLYESTITQKELLDALKKTKRWTRPTAKQLERAKKILEKGDTLKNTLGIRA